jgi:hypothetical protein
MVSKVLNHKKQNKLGHPKGMQLKINKMTFLQEVKLSIKKEKRIKLRYGQNPFRLASSNTSVKALKVFKQVDYTPDRSNDQVTTIPFIEIKEPSRTILVAGKLIEKISESGKDYYVAADCELFRERLNVLVGSGVFVFPEKIKQVFHPVQHQFKINELCMEKDASGNSRRSKPDGSSCGGGLPNYYPACFPASWASLCNCYCMTPGHPRRQWEVGTPTQPNPPPDEYGDSFSTWAMGEKEPSHTPKVSRVEDWQDDPDDPTPNMVSMVEPLEFEAVTGATDIANRANLIKGALLKDVGGHVSPAISTGNGHPVRMNHSGHAWLVVGVDKNGYWDHAPTGGDAWSFTNYCHWENAPWTTDSGRMFKITYPDAGNTLRPEEKRLGCINFEGSGSTMPRIRFVDVSTRTHAYNTDVIHWVPHTRVEPGYQWISQDEPLDCKGFPKSGMETEVGVRIPKPQQQRGRCSNCGSIPDGCSWCRTRLLFPFWVHNTTLDENVTYKLDLFFYNKDRRWERIQPELVPDSRGRTDTGDLYLGFKNIPSSVDRWVAYDLPGCLPGEHFSIQSKDDEALINEDRKRSEPWNSKGFGWFIDFNQDQLTRNGLYGIRLVLSCLDRSGEPICMEQDSKQLWFSVGDPAPE